MRKRWHSKLKKVFAEMRNGTRPTALSVPTLREIVDAPTVEALANYVVELVDNGQVHVLYRVTSPDTKITLAEFGRLYEVPSRVFDESSDSYFRVNPSRDVEIVYSVSEG